MSNTNTITIVEKEVIETLHFPNKEVLISPSEIENRAYDAERAMKLGNQFKDKVKIVFEDNEGLKMVETTVWGLTEERLILKRGTIIPLNRIHDIII